MPLPPVNELTDEEDPETAALIAPGVTIRIVTPFVVCST